MNEESTPARRGRPRGTGIDDTPVLSAVADLLLASPGMRPTTAMKRAVRGVKLTQLRRLQEKWKMDGARLLAEAGERVRLKEEASAGAAAVARAATAGHDQATKRATVGVIDSKVAQAVLGHMDLPGMRAIRDMNDNPAIRAMRDLMDPPFMRHLRKLENSPALKLARDMARLNRLFDPLGRRRE